MSVTRALLIVFEVGVRRDHSHAGVIVLRMFIVKLAPSIELGSGPYAQAVPQMRAMWLVVTAGAFILFLCGSGTFSQTVRSKSTPRTGAADIFTRAEQWDCSGKDKSAKGKIERGRFDQNGVKHDERGVKEGVDEARKILTSCPSCKQFLSGLGREDPIALLNKLVRIKAILVTSIVPQGFKTEYPGRPYRIMVVAPLKVSSEVAAITKDLLPIHRRTGMTEPCIYVNPIGILVHDDPRYGPSKGLTLAHARAIIILHELGHMTGALPKDGGDLKKSDYNNVCVMKNCVPCGTHVTPCPGPAQLSPRPRSRPARRLSKGLAAKRPLSLHDPVVGLSVGAFWTRFRGR